MIQKRIIRIITSLKYFDHSHESFIDLGIMKFEHNSYKGATLDVMVAFSGRPIVLSSREEELLSTRLLDHLSLVAATSPHDRTTSVFIQFLQIGSKKQSVWFSPFVRANLCHVCVFVCVCITTEMPGDCCLCSSICLDVPSRQRRL